MSVNMIDYIRIALYTLLLVLGFFVFETWNKDHPQTMTQAASEVADTRFVPTPADVTSIDKSVVAPTVTQPVLPQNASDEIVHVTTDLLDVDIDTRGGDIINVRLLKFPESLGSKVPFVLLNNDPKTRYIAESGLLSSIGPDTSQAQALYQVSQKEFQLNNNTDTLSVPLTWQNADGIKVNKIFTFTRGSYEIHVGYEINNQSNQSWEGNLYTQLMRTDTPPVTHNGMMNLTTFFGAAVSTPEKPFQKITFKEMHDTPLNKTALDGWAAMLQHYFISAWIPNPTTTSTYYSKVNQNGLYTIGMIGQKLTAAPGTSTSVQAKLYAGPTDGSQLEKASPTLKLTIDYGWFWFISGIIFWMMQKIYSVVGNWGWSIVIVTIIIKLLFYQLSAKSYRSMSALKKLQPRIELLKERYGDDKQKMTQATLELYRQEKVNPMSGCLPILIQIPVFIALYWVLVESVQLRQAPFIFWIKDLSTADPYYILPLMMGASMFLQQRLNPAPADPVQAKVMLFMPVVFTALFANFPAGLMLYWFVNNTLSFLQQWYIMRQVNQEPKNKVKGYGK